jgi:PIN domain nuclease of toxin-antitoxin system
MICHALLGKMPSASMPAIFDSNLYLHFCTQLLMWAADEPQRLSAKARALLLALANPLIFSSSSLWEFSIKNGLDLSDFEVDPRRLWRMLLVNGYRKLLVTSAYRRRVRKRPCEMFRLTHYN